MRMMGEAVGSPPPKSLSPLHVNNFSLPSNSRLPKFMIAAVAGFIVLTTALYYLCKWWCFRKRGGHGAGPSRASEGDGAGSSPDSAGAPVSISEDDLQARASKALAQRLGSKIATAIPSIDFSRLREFRAEKEDGAGVDGEACAICLTEFSPAAGSGGIKILPRCGHAFHSGCIDVWLCTHASCPVCRASLLVVMFSRAAPLRPCSSPSSQDCPSPSNQDQDCLWSQACPSPSSQDQDCPSPSSHLEEEHGENLPNGDENV